MKFSLLQDLVEIYTCSEPAYVKARRWRLQAALAHAPTDALGNAVVTGALALIFIDQVDETLLLTWLAAINFLSIARFSAGVVAARTGGIACERLYLVFVTTLTLQGLLWAASFFLFAPLESIAHRSVVLVWIAGTASWCVAAYTFVIEAVLAFLVVQSLPIAVHLAMSSDRYWQLVAIACFIFIATMAMIAIRNNVLLLRGHITQIENEELVEALAKEKRFVEKLNDALESDLARREDVEANLRHAKARAEELARELEKLSSLDGLTAIANRRRFDHTIDREWQRALRARQPLALILCDIDYFKQYNDRYGHQAGDACLRQLAALLESSLRRGGDLAARYGGEEFAILLPDTRLDNAALLADAIRSNLQRLGLPHETSTVVPVVTASFGVASMLPERDQSPDELVKAADEALYQAKNRGRNRVVSAPQDGFTHSEERGSLLH